MTSGIEISLEGVLECDPCYALLVSEMTGFPRRFGIKTATVSKFLTFITSR